MGLPSLFPSDVPNQVFVQILYRSDTYLTCVHLISIKGGFFKDLFQYFIQHYFIFRPSDPTVSVSEDAGIEPRTVATTALDAHIY
jgi:hypothetical protein